MGRLLTLQEAADECRICGESLKQSIRAGDLKAFKVGGRRGRIVISMDDLQRYVKRGRIKPKKIKV